MQKIDYKRFASYFQDMFLDIYRDKYEDICGMPVKHVTFVLTYDCNFNCTYCYEHNKCKKSMSLSVAKSAIDMLFDKEKNSYIDIEETKAIVLEFIGGEPLLEIDLMNYIIEYFKFKAVSLNHPWALNYMISISTNGSLYNTKKFQDFLKRYDGRVHTAITIDGNKDLHDACRRFKDGSPTYEIVEKAIKMQLQKSPFYVGTKITLSPDNIKYLSDAIINLSNLGLTDVFANCVFEKGWGVKDAITMYSEMKKLADYMLKTKIYKVFQTTLFNEEIGKSLSSDNNTNWCGGTGLMLAICPDGLCYPCLRYMPFSLGDKVKPLVIGNVWDGIKKKEEEIKTLNCLNCITRRSQSTDECFNCPIADGCAWCSAYNYEETGTPDKRVTYICIMHKARVLANCYYWNKLYRQLDMPDRFPMNVPKEWALEIITEDEYNMLVELSK